jgi:hypothetical protein
MKCSNPDCNRGIGLVAYRHGRFGKRRYWNCRDAFVADSQKLGQTRRVTTYFERLLLNPIDKATAEAEVSNHPYKGTLKATRTKIELSTSDPRSTRSTPRNVHRDLRIKGSVANGPASPLGENDRRQTDLRSLVP